jgi:deoxyribonuclease-4
MADHPRFGPAGVPPTFRLMNANLGDVPQLLREEGLDAFEYEAIYWGAKPQIKKEDAEKLGGEAMKNDVWLSLHGSYFINLLGEKQVVEASKKRLTACATAAQWMGAKVVVFHPGFYGKHAPKEAFKICVEALKEIVETMRSLGVKNVRLGAETMGKSSQFGSLDEIIGFCEQVEQTQLVIDWSHLHARNHGRFRKVEDFRKVVEEVESRLSKEAAENMHCHFTKIEYSDKGERRHHVLDEAGYGPSFEMLAKVIAEFKLKPVIICESPLLDIDAVKMRDILKIELNK